MIFTSYKLDKSDKLVDAINNLTINDARYELNKATASDAQGNLTSDPDPVSHTSNGPDIVMRTTNRILGAKILRCRTIGEVPVQTLLENPILLAPQTLMTPVAKKIFADATLGSVWTNRIPRQVISMGVNRTTPWNIDNACGISENSSPDLIGIIGDTDLPCGLNVIQEIGDIRRSISPYFIKSNNLDTFINQQFTNNIFARPIFTEIIVDKLSDMSSGDLHTRCRMNLTEDPVNILALQFVDLGISTIDALDIISSLCALTTRVVRPTNAAHGSATNIIFGITTEVRDYVSTNSDYNYKTNFEIWR